ncbi:MAG TPA: hypothetical protein VII00_05145 [bacterium]
MKDNLGIFIGSVDFIKGEVKSLNERTLGTIQRFNSEGLPFNFDTTFKLTKGITGLTLRLINKGGRK